MTENRPLVSVMIPFHNTPPHFLAEAIESVLAQTYDQWELLLVDDGSTHTASTETAQAYAAAHAEKIHYWEHPDHANKGLGPSRQLAFEQAKGDLIAFLDADDVWLPSKLTEQVALLVAHPEVGAVYGRTKYWHSWTGNPEDEARDTVPPTGVAAYAILPPTDLLILFVRERVPIPCTCSIIVRRKILQAVGGFERGVHGFYYEDQMFYAKTCLFASVLVADQCWDCYRQHVDSGTHDINVRQMEIHQEYLNWLASYLQQHHVVDEPLWRALRQQIWLYKQPSWLPARLYHPARFGKKWALRGEARLPAAIRQRLWAGEQSE